MRKNDNGKLKSQGANGANGSGAVPEHLDARYQFAGWISVKRIPEVDHRIIEPSAKKETKKNSNKNGQGNRSSPSLMDDGGYGRGVAGSIGAGAAQDPRFTYLDTQNLHLTLPPCLQARFKDSKYCVVKGAVMFIYENENMQECLGVITLTNYEVSVPGKPHDGHIFAKRHPLWLKYQHIRHSGKQPELTTNPAKDYYLSMVNCVDKEDLYFTLLRCTKLKPGSRSFLREIPKRDSTQFDKSAMNTLIRSIHSNEHQFHMAWLNAMLGRIFLGVYKTPKVKDAMFKKLEDKLSRIRLPNFINHLRMKSVHLGDGIPLITRPKLLALKPNGDMVMDLNLLYQGGFRAEIEAEAVVTVTKKIQPIKVSLVLVVTLDRLEGRLQAWVKPPPSNRIWYGFYHRPQVEMKIEPVVSDKHIKSNLIIKAIENKLLEAISETFVLPNMDDVAFAETDGVGGIFGEEISPPSTETAQLGVPQHGLKVQPNGHHIPGIRAATFSLGDGATSNPRSAIELPSDLRRRNETVPSGIYRIPAAARSHDSLGGDELLMYDSRSNTATPLDDDPMRSGTSRVGQTSEAADGSGAKVLLVPGGRGIKVANEQGSSKIQGHEGSSGSRLLNRMYLSSTAESIRGRRGSLDPNATLSYSTATSTGNNHSDSHFPAMDEARKMEEHWSQYGISEYDPMSGNTKKKTKGKSDKNDGDHVSVHSKDSGDSASTHTEHTGHTSTFFGHSNSSHSTFDTISASHSSKSDKFSLSKMFHGLRKKHTKGANSGSSLQQSIDESGVHAEGSHEGGSVLAGDDESTLQERDDSMYSPVERSSGETGASSAREVQEEYEQMDSPAPSIYAASLFGGEEHYGKISPTSPQQNSLGNFGATFRRLRSRSRSGSSRADLSIPEDLDYTIGQYSPDEDHGLTEADSSSQIGLEMTERYKSHVFTERSDSDTYLDGQRPTGSDSPPSICISPSEEKEQLPCDSKRKSISFPKLQSGFGYMGASTPLIVLEMPSPHTEIGTDGLYGRSSMDDSRLRQSTPDRQLQVLHGSGTSSPVYGNQLDSSTADPRRHSLSQASILSSSASTTPTSSMGYTMHRHIHVQTHGVGTVPTSPLRREFNRDDDDDDVGVHRASTEYDTGESMRKGSETYSILSKTSSLPSYSPSEPHGHNHHHHGLRNILTSIGHKGKHKHSSSPITTSPMDLDPYGNDMDVDVVEVVEMNRTYTTQGVNDDPFAYAGGVDVVADRYQSEQSSTHTAVHQKALGNSQEIADAVGKIGPGLSPLLESLAATPTQSIMGKAVALDVDYREVALQARPGHVGEFPTPIRMHSLLDREEGAVLTLAEDGKDVVPTIEKVDQANEEYSPQPLQDVSLSYSEPLSHGPLSLESISMPLPETRTPALVPDKDASEGRPYSAPEVDVYEPYEAPPKDLDILEFVEPNDENSTHNAPPGLSHEQSNPDGSGQEMTRRECEARAVNPLQLDPHIEEPSLEKPLPKEPSFEKPSLEELQFGAPVAEEYAAEEHDQDTRQSSESYVEVDQSPQQSTQTSTHSAIPSSPKKSHHRNIFKRLIRRKSDDSMKDQQSLYKSPSMSKSQTSILNHSSGSNSPRSLSFFHRHHSNNNNQQQQQQQQQQQLLQQQQEENQRLDQDHPHGHEYKEYTTLQVPEGCSPHDASSGRPRSNSSGSLAKEGLTRVRSRPRSSTIHTTPSH
ncbi:hypothetical protein BGX26_002971 [Mortierella sp. AD094]|nr:hypothetical protein BGX26_002971 [Mortierella sp. AD094]